MTYVKGLHKTFDDAIVSVLKRTGISSSLYYFLFSRKFDREHKAVLSGRVNYQRTLVDIGQSSALLRRNIHRLEKGLIMRPRKKTFARDYIFETVEIYKNCVESGQLCGDELKWASDVISNYFGAVESQGIVATSKQNFLQIYSAPQNSELSIPYIHEELPESDISYDQLYQLFKRRRSVRWFLDKAVESEKIEKAVRAASLAPSACNRLPYRFHVANDKELASEIAEFAIGTSGFSQNFPCLIVIVGDLSSYPFERDRHLIYIDASLAAMQLMLSLESLGLSSCPINWPDIDDREEKLGRKLALEDYERATMLLAVGYGDPTGGIPFSQKKGTDLLIKDIPK